MRLAYRIILVTSICLTLAFIGYKANLMNNVDQTKEGAVQEESDWNKVKRKVGESNLDHALKKMQHMVNGVGYERWNDYRLRFIRKGDIPSGSKLLMLGFQIEKEGLDPSIMAFLFMNTYKEKYTEYRLVIINYSDYPIELYYYLDDYYFVSEGNQFYAPSPRMWEDRYPDGIINPNGYVKIEKIFQNRLSVDQIKAFIATINKDQITLHFVKTK